MIDFVCHSCGLIYHADEAHEGKAIKCSQCGTILRITRTATPEEIRPSSASASMMEEKSKARGILFRLLSVRRRKWVLAICAAALTVGTVWLVGSRSPNVPSPIKSENNPVTVSADELEQQSATEKGASPSKTQPTDRIPTVAEPELSPAIVSEPANALQNGTRLAEDVGTHGRGVLVLRNGNDGDAVVNIIETASDTTVRWVYVTAHSDLKLSHIEPGSYLLLFTTGIDWDEDNFEFRKHAEYRQMDRNIDFEKHLPAGVDYKRVTVTLHRILEGNIPSHQISEAEFRRRNRGQMKVNR
jgi:hypothetical protein